MADVQILIAGYTSADHPGEEKTQPTVTLVRDGDLVMVIDPGVVENQQVLIDSLEAQGLKVDDVKVVAITHSHLDHYRNVGLFAQAKTLEYYGLWQGNQVADWSEQFTPHIRIIKTPGHSADSLTFLIETEKGRVAVCGDVFWKENYPDHDPYANDPEELKVSRQKVLELADWIVPGHGPRFAV